MSDKYLGDILMVSVICWLYFRAISQRPEGKTVWRYLVDHRERGGVFTVELHVGEWIVVGLFFLAGLILRCFGNG